MFGLKNGAPDMPQRIKQGELLVHFIDESGTVPEVYNDPKLRKLSQQIWHARMEEMRKELGSKEPVIQRACMCRHCGIAFSLTIPMSAESIGCPQCQAPIKFA
jgi:hypothetical protein